MLDTEVVEVNEEGCFGIVVQTKGVHDPQLADDLLEQVEGRVGRHGREVGEACGLVSVLARDGGQFLLESYHEAHHVWIDAVVPAIKLVERAGRLEARKTPD